MDPPGPLTEEQRQLLEAVGLDALEDLAPVTAAAPQPAFGPAALQAAAPPWQQQPQLPLPQQYSSPQQLRAVAFSSPPPPQLVGSGSAPLPSSSGQTDEGGRPSSTSRKRASHDGEDREAKLKRQQEQNKAAQQRYRQRRKQRHEEMEVALEQHKHQLHRAVAYSSALEARVASLEAALAAGSSGGGGVPQQQAMAAAAGSAGWQPHQKQQLALAGAGGIPQQQGLHVAAPGAPPPLSTTPQRPPSALSGGSPLPPIGPPPFLSSAALAVRAAGPMQPHNMPSPSGSGPSSSGVRSGEPAWPAAAAAGGSGPLAPSVSAQTTALRQLNLGGDAGGGPAGHPAAGAAGGTASGASPLQYCSSIAAVQAFVRDHDLRGLLRTGQPLPAELLAPLHDCVQAVATQCAAAINVTLPGMLELLIDSAQAGGCCVADPVNRAAAAAVAAADGGSGGAAGGTVAAAAQAAGPLQQQPPAPAGGGSGGSAGVHGDRGSGRRGGSGADTTGPSQSEDDRGEGPAGEQPMVASPGPFTPRAGADAWRTADRRRWLQVLADIALTDSQISQILTMRTDLLRALNRCFAEREGLAERLLHESLSAGGAGGSGAGGAPGGGPTAVAAGSALLSAAATSAGGPMSSSSGAGGAAAGGHGRPHLTAQADRMRQEGYLSEVARGSLAVRDLLQQMEATLKTEGRLLGDFTLCLMTQVLAPVQAAVMASESFPFATDALNLANALSEVHHILPRLSPLLGYPTATAPMPTGALIAAAAAAAAAALGRESDPAEAAAAAPAAAVPAAEAASGGAQDEGETGSRRDGGGGGDDGGGGSGNGRGGGSAGGGSGRGGGAGGGAGHGCGPFSGSGAGGGGWGDDGADSGSPQDGSGPRGPPGGSSGAGSGSDGTKHRSHPGSRPGGSQCCHTGAFPGVAAVATYTAGSGSTGLPAVALLDSDAATPPASCLWGAGFPPSPSSPIAAAAAAFADWCVGGGYASPLILPELDSSGGIEASSRLQAQTAVA